MSCRHRPSAASTQLSTKTTPSGMRRPPPVAVVHHSSPTALVKAYEKIDPLAVLPIHTRLVEKDLVQADAQRYRLAARRLAGMRKIAAGTSRAADVDALIKDLRENHRRRSRLQQEFDRAGLP